MKLYVDKNDLVELPYFDAYGGTGSPNGVWIEVDKKDVSDGYEGRYVKSKARKAKRYKVIE